MNYPKMSETRAWTIIVDEIVSVRLWGKGAKHYWNLGYAGEYGEYIDVYIEDMPHGSHAKVLCRCPVCEVDRYIQYKDVISRGNTLHQGCSNRLDLSGLVFGRWTVIEPEIDGNSSASRWFCKCECGEMGCVQSYGLINGTSQSCGCLNRENSSKRSGRNHPKYNSKIMSCEYCGKECEVKLSWTSSWRFCSHSCTGAWFSENLSGENSPHWDSSITEEERIIKRSYAEIRQWAKDVLRKDQYMCQICGSTEDIQAHHMFSYKHHPEYRLDVEFGLTMCKADHIAFHSWNGGFWKECIPSDIDRWLYETSQTY